MFKSCLRALIALLLAACNGTGADHLQGNPGGGGPSSAGLALLAGHAEGAGSVDGTGPAARFDSPHGLAFDATGNVYVGDRGNFTVRTVSPAGVVTTLAGSAGVPGAIDSTGASAAFADVFGIAADSSGNVYVADRTNDLIRKISPGGVVTTLAGTAGVAGSADGPGFSATFDLPTGVAVDGFGNVYVVDAGNDTIRRITPAGVVSTLAGTAGASGSADGVGAAARFNQPTAVAVDGGGTLYVADTGNQLIRKITSAGSVSTMAGSGSAGHADGTGAAASFNSPSFLAATSTGTVYVADSLNYTVRMITPAGVVTTFAGTAGASGTQDGLGAAARFSVLEGIAVDRAGNLVVADLNDAIRRIDTSGMVTTLAGSPYATGSADGTGSAAFFGFPVGLASDSTGNLYAADTGNATIRKIAASGAVTTLAGSAGHPGSIDGSGAQARFALPTAVATDKSGNVYVADTTNSTIRVVSPAGAVVTLAGAAGVNGSADGVGPLARFFAPSGVAVDGSGNVYVADTSNYTIRRISTSGMVSTVAGLAGVAGNVDGNGAGARFSGPAGLATDSAGNVYIIDGHAIRLMTPAGNVSTLAGSVTQAGSIDGTGAGARFYRPIALVVDSSGDVYVSDRGNYAIRKITPAGAVTTVVGQSGLGGFMPGSLPGEVGRTGGLALGGTALYLVTNNAVASVTNVP